MHVATASVQQLIDYCKNTPADGLRSAASVQVRNELIRANLALLKAME
jgi:4-O-beta-D-mannosyl-D-glucose phosphorylase